MMAEDGEDKENQYEMKEALIVLILRSSHTIASCTVL